MRFFEAKEHGLQTTSNPLFPHKERRRTPWGIIIGVVVVTFAVAAVILAIFGPWLRVRTVTVSGNVTVPSSDIERVAREVATGNRFVVLPADHQWFIDEKKIEEQLRNAFPLKSLDVTTQGNTIQITVVEDVFMIALRSGDSVLFLDRMGKVMRETTPEEKAALLVRLGEAQAPSDIQLPVLNPAMPIIRDTGSRPRTVGEGVFSAEVMNNVVAFDEGLRKLSIVPSQYENENPEEPWFTVRSDKPYALLFDAEQDAAEQLAVLKTVLDEYFATQPEARYVDVRFGHRVYVK